jgi:regulator of PEP synthase PpsR (kinase-PPPase family)
MSYQILDNFLEQSDFENIRKSIINNRFPFYIQDTVAYNKTQQNFNAEFENQYWNWYAIHTIYDDDEPKSELYSIIKDTIVKKIKTITQVNSLLRIKVNLYPHTDIIKQHDMHKDYDGSHKAAVFSLNTCDGYTKFIDGDIINSIENRIVLFDGSEYHCSSTTTNAKARYNINFNWL